MNTNDFLIQDHTHRQLCTLILKMLNCNLLWIMNLERNSLNMLVTDQSVLGHYWDKKYYLDDPNLTVKPPSDQPPWKVTLGTDCDTFDKNGFLRDLYKMFHVEEFVTIEKRTKSEHYCFRFFTKNNRFVFMNKLLNNMPIIKYFINAMTEKYRNELHKQPGISIRKLKQNRKNYANR